MQSQEWKVEFFVPQATVLIWRRETRTMATPMRSLSVGVAKSVREWLLDRRGRGDDCVHRHRSIAKSVQKRSSKKYRNRSETERMSLTRKSKVSIKVR